MSESCKQCRYFFDRGPGSMDLCRRYPPTMLLKTGKGFVGEYHDTQTAWPEIGREDWCGEYQEREP